MVMFLALLVESSCYLVFSLVFCSILMDSGCKLFNHSQGQSSGLCAFLVYFKLMPPPNGPPPQPVNLRGHLPPAWGYVSPLGYSARKL